MSLQKAWIEVEAAAGIGDGRIDCQFNPTELDVSKSTEWRAPPTKGTSSPTQKFERGRPGTLTVQLICDTTSSGNPVTTHTDALMQLMEVSDSLPSADAKVKRPPWVVFHWGDWHSFKSFVRSVDLRFVQFSQDGVPLRARARLEMEQLLDESNQPAQNPTSGTPRPHRVHQVQVGETLDRIAWKHFGSPVEWRRIAHANRIVDPLSVRPGDLLTIPERGD